MIDKVILGQTSLPVQDFDAVHWEDQAVLGAKNLLPNNATSQTINGVTFTVNNDGSVTANGTATNNTSLTLHSYTVSEFNEINAKALILNGCPAGGGRNTYRLDVISNTETTKNLEDIGSGITVPVNWFSEGTISVRLRIGNGTTVNNLTFKPMLRLASDPDDTYVPHAMTNRELTESVTPSNISFTITLDANIIHSNTTPLTLYSIGKLKILKGAVIIQENVNSVTWKQIAAVGNEYAAIVNSPGVARVNMKTDMVDCNIWGTSIVIRDNSATITSGSQINIDLVYISK